MAAYDAYIVENVLNDGVPVSYRMLSRALRLHHRYAKQALYDFYQRHNGKKAGSVSATYCLTGRSKQVVITQQQNGTDSHDKQPPPRSSPPALSSSAPQPPRQPEPPKVQQQQEGHDDDPIWIRRVIIAKEADLPAAKTSLDEIESVHIYALSPAPLTDLETLSECCRRVREDYVPEDPLNGAYREYGIIQNKEVRRRSRTGRPVPVAAPVLKVEFVPKQKQEPSSSPAERPARPPTLKKESSSIMSSFAKSKTVPKKEIKSEPTQPEDDAPALSDEDADPDGDGGDGMDIDDDGSQPAQPIKGKAEREAELLRMMDEDEQEAADANNNGDADQDGHDPDEAVATNGDASQKSHASEQDVDMPDASEPEQPATQESQGTDGTAKVSNGRRRGRRRIMVKKTVKDEEGYLVTKEEAAWESFSEDDAPQAKKAKLPPPSSSAGSAGSSSVMSQFAKGGGAKKAGGGGGAGKGGGKGIMGFFAKK